MLEKIMETIEDHVFEKLDGEKVQEVWQELPARSHLEKVVDLYGTPAMITHRDSASVIYANQAARETLGEEFFSRKLNCAEKKTKGPIRANVQWETKNGHKEFELQSQKVFRGKRGLGEFYLLEARVAG